MKAMFSVTFRIRSTPSQKFSTETVIADNATEAITKASRKAAMFFKSEPGLFASDVTLLGVES
jgi:hypothetical protein